MRVLRYLLLVLGAFAVNQGCSCNHNAGNNGDGGAGGDDMSVPISGGDINIMPADATLDITPGGAAAPQAYTATDKNGQDITAQAAWSVDDTTLGAFSGSTFTSNVDHGGTTLVHATYNGLTGFATLHVKLHATVPSDNCPNCPPFPGSGTPMCTVTAQTPTVLYPPDGILVPPNMNVLELQYDQGAGNSYFEIDYENAATDVRVLTQCTPITDSKTNATNGCAYDLSQQVWDYIAQSNRGGDPLNIIVRATDANGSCIATSQTQVAISFGEEDLNGGVYYWQSVKIAATVGAAGGIFRYDFGKRGQTPEPFLAPLPGATSTRCIGCHFLSRDGVKMTYGNDDPDADDEYSDLSTTLLDVATKAATPLLDKKGGFQAFTPDHSQILASNGTPGASTNNFLLFDGNASGGTAPTPTVIPTGTVRGTQPDYSADGTRVVFVEPQSYTFSSNTKGFDNHFFGGSLFTMSANGATFGTPMPLLTSAGENNYYPAFTPDGAFVVFNRVPLTGAANMAGTCVNPASTAGTCPNDAFSNPNARIFIMPAAGGAPIDLANINGTGPLENSWPRFAPTTQKYKGDTIAWVTFASTRDYGDVVRNSAMVGGMPQHLCYPPESPENTSTNKNVIEDPSCLQPQLWMAAINLSKASSGADPSLPAFWLPFQDSTAHNHIAQWVVKLVGPPNTGDMGTCVPDGTTCSTGGAVCCNGICCSNNTCGCIP
jgi:hypothetical protein